MIDPNKDTSPEVLKRLKAASYERFRIQLLNAVEKLLEDFEMSWDDLAEKLQWPSVREGLWGYFPKEGPMTGETLKKVVGSLTLTTEEINDIAHVFSTEPYIIFRPRKPWTRT